MRIVIIVRLTNNSKKCFEVLINLEKQILEIREVYLSPSGASGITWNIVIFFSPGLDIHTSYVNFP